MKEKNKVLFLDVDGVLTSARTGWFNMDIYAVNFISWCCQQAGYKIVISSTWRHTHGKDFWDTIFPGLIHDQWRTPAKLSLYRRGGEISLWLYDNPAEEYIILDDDTDFSEEQFKRFVHTDSGDGLLLKHMMQMRDLMGITGYFKEDTPLYQHDHMFGHHNF